jgi:hypothetical protein
MSHIPKLIFLRAKMTTLRKVPTFDEMMWPTLLALKQMGGSASNQELLTCVMKLMAIPEEIQNLPHGDGPKSEIEYRMLWTRTYLHKVGAIQNSERGVWSITAAGNALTADEVKNIVAQVRVMDRKQGGHSERSSADRLEEEEPAERWRMSYYRLCREWRRRHLSGSHSGSCANRDSYQSRLKTSREMEESTELGCYESISSRFACFFNVSATRVT